MSTRTKTMNRTINLFRDFFKSEKASGFTLIGCTLISLLLANSRFGASYLHILHQHLDLSFGATYLDYSIETWINDGLMSIFFLMVGLEIERELYVGELSRFKNAILPLLAALGGMIVPAFIHLAFNAGKSTQAGFGIPMATDIAFALGILSLAGKRIPVTLKVFLTALAIIDDLGAITVIALFYTKNFSWVYFSLAIGIFLALFIMGKLKIYSLYLYLIPGALLWYFMLRSGVHASISGVLLAFAIPFHKENSRNSSYYLQHKLHKPVAYIIIPLFALANTAIVLPTHPFKALSSLNSIGIIAGLVAGKFIGIFFICFLAIKLKVAELNSNIRWSQLAGVACLGGIGFTMSIFITNLAFNDQLLVTASKLSIFIASFMATIIGLIILKIAQRKSQKIHGVS